MRRIELLIKQVQRDTENEREGTEDGISLEDYYSYFTRGQMLLQRAFINGTGNKAFRKTDTFSANGSETYDNMPFDIFASNLIVGLAYSESGNEQDFYPLEKRTELERSSGPGRPSQYIIESETLKVNAYPSSGTFRRTYNKRLPRLDKRRATVASFTNSGTALTALTLSTTTPFNQDDYDLYDHLCVVGKDGTVKMRGIPYDSVAANGVVAITDSSYTYPSGSTIATGDHVCLGEYHSTHSQLDDSCEEFLIEYCTKRILMRDSSTDVDRLIMEELNPLVEAIIESYSVDSDIDQIPVVDYSYFQDLD